MFKTVWVQFHNRRKEMRAGAEPGGGRLSCTLCRCWSPLLYRKGLGPKGWEGHAKEAATAIGNPLKASRSSSREAEWVEWLLHYWRNRAENVTPAKCSRVGLDIHIRWQEVAFWNIHRTIIRRRHDNETFWFCLCVLPLTLKYRYRLVCTADTKVN